MTHTQKINAFKDSFDIIACNSFNENLSNHSSHITYSMKILLIDLLDEKLLEKIKKITQETNTSNKEHFIKGFEGLIPLSRSSISSNPTESNVSLTTICSANNTHGTGRHIADMCSHWLVPGKQIPLTYVFSFVFSFNFLPENRFLIHQINANILDNADVPTIKKTLPIIDKEIKISIKAVQHARSVVSKSSLSDEKKKQLIHQNLESLIKKPNIKSNESLHNHIQQLFVKLTCEKKTSLLNQKMPPLIASNLKIFKRDIFVDLQNFLLQFKNDFIFTRSISHLAKLVSNIYLFKKNMAQQIIGNPNQRHLHLKILNSEYENIQEQPFLALLICINILKPNEVIAKKHIESALQTTLLSSFQISFFESIDKTNHGMRILYFEIVKEDGSKFHIKELNELKTQLAKSIRVHIKRTTNPLFMPKNEEEILKNVITLSRQLKYVQDIPQIMINFQRQTDNDLIFTVIILRILKPNSFDIKQKLNQISEHLTLENIMVKVVGYLRRKHQKQASVFDIRLSKRQFLQQDFSVDLYEPRSSIFFELSKQLGQIRDFNGGLIFKQNEVYAQLKQNITKTTRADEFVLKNFFYKITPSHMQGVIDPIVLEKAFYLSIQHPNIAVSQNYQILDTLVEKHYCLLINSVLNNVKCTLNAFLHTIENPPILLASSSNASQRVTQTVFIFKIKQLNQQVEFKDDLQKFFDKAQEHVKTRHHNELEIDSASSKSSYELYNETKNRPNLMLNEHL